MCNSIKQICLYLTVVTLVLLLCTIPDPVIAWIDEHWGFICVISTVSWIGYCACDNRNN